MALKLAPGLVRAQALAVALASDEGDVEKAERTLGDMLTRPVDQGWAAMLFGQLAEVYVRKGDIDAADEAYKRDVELAPASPWAKGEYARFLVQKGSYDAALEMANQALFQLKFGMAKRVEAQVYCVRGEMLLWNGDTDGASTVLWQAEGADHTYARASYDIGALHQYLGVTGRDGGEVEQARSWYRKAIALDPTDGAAAAALAALGG
jgi:Tfp pilus assembly protein PilF